MNNLTTLALDGQPIPYSMKKHLSGKERNSVRAQLRKALKSGKLQVRRTYYYYYDSCHAPEITPNAPWLMATPSDTIWQRELRAGGANVYELPDGTYELTTCYATHEVRVIKP